MAKSRLRTAEDVSAWRLCVGCGVCVYACPEKKITMVDFPHDGIRPRHDKTGCGSCSECVRVCPGRETATSAPRGGAIPALAEAWGPVLEVWEGHASDPEIRFQGSSGGATSAISLYCLEKEGMHGVLHTGADGKTAWKNRALLSSNRNELLSRTGSRYSPACPGSLLGLLETAPLPSLFVGKPCDVAGMRKVQASRNGIRSKVAAAIAIFCAGTPSTQGTLDLFQRLEINPENVEEVRYRGRGWPGMFAVRMRGEDTPSAQIPYMDAWAFLEPYRPFRCYLCPDPTGEVADVSCGDPWYRKMEREDKGYSLILVRTEKGRQIVSGAMAAGYLTLKRLDPAVLKGLQKEIFAKKQAIWGRLLALKAFGIPTPGFRGFDLFSHWTHSPLKEKARSLLGTARRIIQRKYYRPIRRA